MFILKILVAELRTENDPDGCLKTGTLMDLFKLSGDPEKYQPVNVLDIPMGDMSVGVPPQYRYVLCLCATDPD